MHVEQVVKPGESAKVPGEQVWQAGDEVFGLEEPAEQLLQFIRSVAAVNWPGGQLEHMALDDKLHTESTYSPF